MTGPIRGETSMAAVILGALFSTKPNAAKELYEVYENKQTNIIIMNDQKVFGHVRIYYTILEFKYAHCMGFVLYIQLDSEGFIFIIIVLM